MMNPSPSVGYYWPFKINTSTARTITSPVINVDPGLPSDPPRNALNLLADYQSSSSLEPTPEKLSDTSNHQFQDINSTGPSRPPWVNPANVTPTCQEPLQIRFNEAVDLLNELRTICEILLPGHGQFLCHFIYLYFLPHIRLPD